MSGQQKVQSGTASGILNSPPKLVRLNFEYEGVEISEGTPLEYEWGLSITRIGPLEIGVEFSLALTGIPDLTANATYRMLFKLQPESREAQDPEGTFQVIAARMGPVSLYPFIREALVSSGIRALVDTFTLPIVYVGALFDPNEIEVPPVPEEDGASNGEVTE